MISPHRPAPAFRPSLHWLILLALLLAGCRADQATKSWAREEIRDRHALTLIPQILEFRYAENRAIAFSMFHDLPERVRAPLIFTLSGAALAALLTLIWKMRGQSLLRLLPLALILAGAFGNLQDRLIHGYVVDFIHVHWREAWSFPIFNLADSLITVGTTLLFFLTLPGMGPGPQRAKESESV